MEQGRGPRGREELDQLSAAACALVETIARRSPTVDARRASGTDVPRFERVRLWDVDRRRAWWRPWHEVDAWLVYECPVSYSDGTAETRSYWLLPGRKDARDVLDPDVAAMVAVDAGLREIERSLTERGAGNGTATSDGAEPGRIGGRPLAALDWTALDRAWRRRDDGAIRPAIARLLGAEAFEPWDGLVRVTVDENGTGRPVPDADQPARAARAVAVLLGAADARGDGATSRAELRALAASYMYFALLAAWELSDSHAPISHLAHALAAATRGTGIGDGDATPGEDDAAADADAVTRSVGILAQALELQLRCETDLFCSCPVGLEADAGELVSLLREPASAAERDGRVADGSVRAELAHLPDASADRSGTARLAALVKREGVHTLVHAEFLGDAARTGGGLVDAMSPPGTCPKSVDRAEAREQISRAADHARSAIALLEGSVYASEVRPYLQSYDRMLDGLRGPSMLVDEGEIVLMYPFGLPNVSTAPHDLVREILETSAARRSPATNRLLRTGLLGMPIEARYNATSNTFAVFGAGDDADSAFGARLTFAEHRLMVETTAGTRMEDVDLEIRLGSYGNHVVRIAFTTEHRTVWIDPERSPCREEPECPHLGACLDGPWTAHDVEQWVRRAGIEVGDERIWLEGPRRTSADRVQHRHLVDLAEAIVGALQAALDDDDDPDGTDDADDPDHADGVGARAHDRGEVAPPGHLYWAVGSSIASPRERTAAAAEADGHADALRRVNDVQANAHVMIVVKRASAREVDGAIRPVGSGAELVELFGGRALVIPQRGLAPTLEDWVRYAPPKLDDLLGAAGHPGDLLVVNGDVTLLCALGSPNWVTLESQHLLEFGTSIIGPLAAWSVWLRKVSQRSADTLANAVSTNDVRGLLEESAWIARNLGYVRSLMDRLRSAQLMRSHRDRDLLARFMAQARIEALQESLDASIDATLAQRSYSVAQAERLIEARKKRVDLVAAWMLGILALSGVIGFLTWAGRAWDWTDEHRRLFDLAVLVAAGVVLVVARLEWSARHEEYSRRATYWVIGALVVVLGALWIFRADDRWPWNWSHGAWFDVSVGTVVVIALAAVAVVMLVWRLRPNPRRRARR